MTTYIVLALLALTILAAAWVLAVRPWMRRQTEGWAKSVMDRLEPVEIVLYKKSESIAWARFKYAMGAAVTLLTSVGAIDVTPYVAYFPEEYRLFVYLTPLLAGVLAGWMQTLLREDTKKPLEIVALPSAVPPAVEEARTIAEAANTYAVAVAQEASATPPPEGH